MIEKLLLDKDCKLEIYNIVTGELKYIFYAFDKKIRDPQDLKKIVGNIADECFFIKIGNDKVLTDGVERTFLYLGKNPTKEFLIEHNKITALKYVDFDTKKLVDYDYYDFDENFIYRSGQKKFEIKKIPLINDKKSAFLIAKENGIRIIDFNYGLRNHKGIVIECIKNDPYSFKYVAKKLKNNKEFVIKALNYGVDYRLLSDELKCDKDVVIAALKNGHNSIVNVDKMYMGDIDVIRVASKYELLSNSFLEKLDPEIANDKIVQQYQFINGLLNFRINEKIPKIISNKEIASEFIEIRPSISKYFTDELKDDIELATKVAKINGNEIFNFSKRIQDEYDIILAAVKSAPRILGKIDKKFLKDRNIVETAFSKDPYTLEFDKFNLISVNKEMALSLVEKYPFLIEKFPKHFKEDREIVTIAVSKSANIIDMVDKKFLKDKEIIKLAVKGGWLKKVVKKEKYVVFKDYYGNSSESSFVVYGIDENKLELIKQNFPDNWEEIISYK